MAKTIKEWFDIIDAEKQLMNELQNLQPQIDNAQTLLDDLSSPSKVSEHRLWIWLTAVAAWLMEVLFDRHKSEVNAIIDIRQFGTLPWYREQCLAYQHGDSLVWINNRFSYATDNPDARIIGYAAAVNGNSAVIIKVAKDSNGPVKLTNSELVSFTSYINQIQPPGVGIIIYSLDADLLKIEIDVYYDALVLYGNGEKISDSSYPVLLAIDNYLSGNEFAGKFDLVSLIDAIQLADGVRKPYIVSCEAKESTGVVWQAITRAYEPVAGYMSLNTLTINYIPYV